VIRSMLDLAHANGFEIVQPSSDKPSAYAAVDGPNEIEREIAAYLPLARTELAVRVLLAQEDAWAQLDASTPPDVVAAILADHSLYHLLHPPTVAIVGAANVGKSTLANQLFGQERSITADIPGTTRDWIGEIANVNGFPVMLVDTPGQRITDDAIEHAAIAASRKTIDSSQLIILVLDASRPLGQDQLHVLAEFPSAKLVANKCDQPWAWDVNAKNAIKTSATTGAGLASLRQTIARHFNCDSIELTQPRWWTQRQRDFLGTPIS